jgi:hypothetical protein
MKKIKLSNFTFDQEKHIARLGDIIIPTITQLLQEFGLVDYSMVPPDVLENKRIIGTRVHAATVMLDNGTLDEDHFEKSFPECVGYLNAYRKFRIIENFEPEYKENRYFSSKWLFSGAPDESGAHYGKLGNENSLVEYKCTWNMYKSTGIQLAAQSMLLKECAGIAIKRRFGLLLKATGNYELTEFKDRSDFQDFQACLVLHWTKRNKCHTSNFERMVLNGNGN